MKTLSIIKVTMLATVAGLLTTANVGATLNLGLPAIHINSSNPSDSAIAAAIGISDIGSLLYKTWPPGGDGHESGSLKISYTSDFDPSSGKGTTTITYQPGLGHTVADATCLVIDAGDCSYVWNISNWNGTEDIQIADITPSRWDAICDVEIYGKCATAVPEPSTVVAGALLLVPFGVSVARNLRRKQN